jgi:hypothetical protein
MGEWRYSYIILDIGTRWEWSASRPGPLCPRYPVDSRLGGPQTRSRRCEEKNLAPAGIRTPDVQPVAIMTRNFKIIFHKNQIKNHVKSG